MNFLNSKTAVITGASRGIGRATALFLAEKGMNIVAMARHEAALRHLSSELASIGVASICHAGDVAEFQDVERIVSAAVDQFGGVDLLVNNAGLIDPIARLAESDVAAWDYAMDVNVKGVYHGLRAVIPVMQERGGTIINISSGAATSTLEGWSAYCASKAAVLSLTKSAHQEYHHLGINTVGLSPGTVATDMQSTIKDSGINPVSQLDWSSHIPAEWVARAVAYIAAEGGEGFSGSDFSLKTNEGRALVGLPRI
ncbi:short-chain dehydrogenase [Arenicella chitinivorans]|uniref:Short-chain dehydrogenase n=1 Tax=Arenicella chitinivorans TaxID=1329800 RepID=A0A918RT85_9GAMM|nr:SDR family oxidoreductase [Arenicella chitinivorans]GHA10378.1 short-chain dehydrogenase [Arenicella chitinivorans]